MFRSHCPLHATIQRALDYRTKFSRSNANFFLQTFCRYRKSNCGNSLAVTATANANGFSELARSLLHGSSSHKCNIDSYCRFGIETHAEFTGIFNGRGCGQRSAKFFPCVFVGDSRENLILRKISRGASHTWSTRMRNVVTHICSLVPRPLLQHRLFNSL